MRRSKPQSEAGLQALEQALDYQFTRRELIIEALTHRSFHHEKGGPAHNERLEFLGDTVLDLVVAEALLVSHNTHEEGLLSKLRAHYVSETSLAKAARKLNLGSVVRLGKGEDLSGGRNRDALLADTLEAVFAAIYLDAGLLAVRPIVLKVLDIPADAPLSEVTDFELGNFKSKVQELFQAETVGTPTYLYLKALGPDHQKVFTMALILQGKEICRAEGATKKDATQKAAKTCLDTIQEMGLEDFIKFYELKRVQSKIKSSKKKEKTEKHEIGAKEMSL